MDDEFGYVCIMLGHVVHVVFLRFFEAKLDAKADLSEAAKA